MLAKLITTVIISDLKLKVKRRIAHEKNDKKGSKKRARNG